MSPEAHRYISTVKTLAMNICCINRRTVEAQAPTPAQIPDPGVPVDDPPELVVVVVPVLVPILLLILSHTLLGKLRV
jgi:hypothetical protein